MVERLISEIDPTYLAGDARRPPVAGFPGEACLSGVINARPGFGEAGFLEKAASVDSPEISDLNCDQVHQRPQPRWQAKHGRSRNAFQRRESH